jgi:hypothetical protein
MTISKTPLNKEELAEWNNTMVKLFDVMRDMDVTEVINMLMHAVAGVGIMNGVTKENLMEGLDVTYDAIYESSQPTDLKGMH